MSGPFLVEVGAAGARVGGYAYACLLARLTDRLVPAGRLFWFGGWVREAGGQDVMYEPYTNLTLKQNNTPPPLPPPSPMGRGDQCMFGGAAQKLGSATVPSCVCGRTLRTARLAKLKLKLKVLPALMKRV